MCLCLILSCTNTNAQTLQAELVNLVQSGNFEKIGNLKNSELKKIAKLQDGALYYLAMHLEEHGNRNSAKRLLRYGFEHYDAPYAVICENLFLRLADVEERISRYEENIAKLEKTIKRLEKKATDTSATEINEYRTELTSQQSALDAAYIEAGLFDKLSVSFETYIAEREIPQTITTSLEKYISENQNGTSHRVSAAFANVTSARILYVQRYYQQSANLVLEIFRSFLQTKNVASSAFFTRPVISDFGKAVLAGVSGKENNIDAANLFESVYAQYLAAKGTPVDAISVQNLPDSVKGVLHALAFYTARLYEKLGKEQAVSVISYYEAAQQFAPSAGDFDNALWYELKFFSQDNKVYLEQLLNKAPIWKNAYHYDDLVSELTVKYTQEKNTAKLSELQAIIAPTQLNEAKAKLSYIIGRLTNSKTKLKEAFDLKQNSFYYTMMSAYMLGEKARFRFQTQYTRTPYKNFSVAQSKAIIDGLLRFSLYAAVYPHIREYAQTLSVSDAEEYASALYNAGFIAESMQVIQFALRSQGAEITPESLKLLYPRAFSESVTRYASEHNIPEYFVYALIRAESFFRPQVVSRAGAVGLTQLMPATASDIARAFKLENYDSTDPDTNIRFGVYYLRQMIKNQKVIARACQAYNAGGGNVRRWTRLYGTLPADIFTEATPFAETRNYAKQILESACMYALLYYNTSSEKVIEEFYGF